jgi:hypothetical protein
MEAHHLFPEEVLAVLLQALKILGGTPVHNLYKSELDRDVFLAAQEGTAER